MCVGAFSGNPSEKLKYSLKLIENMRFLTKLTDRKYAQDLKAAKKDAELVLEKKAWSMPQEFRFGDYTVVPMRAGEEVEWSVTEVTP